MGTLALTSGSVLYFHKFEGGSLLTFAGLSLIIIVMIV